MAKVKIKSNNSNDPLRKHKLLEILAKNDIYATKIIAVQDGFVVITANEPEMDKIFNNKTDKDLNKEGFSPQIPLELKAKRSVLIFKTENDIFNNDEELIKEEIEQKNDWVGQILQVQKFPAHNIMKITFDETIKANKATERGLLAFSMRLPSYDIKVDTFHSITTCYRCYRMEDHPTNNCPKEKTYKICSNCSQEGHSWKECKERYKKCLSCGGDHGTLEMKCPVRKEIISQKRKEKETTPTSYKEATTKNTVTSQAIYTQPAINTEDHLKIFACMLHAHFINVAYPGCYGTELKKTLKLNKLPEIEVPSDPPSQKIIGAISNDEKQSQPQNEENEATKTREDVAPKEKLNKTGKESKPTKQTQEKKTKVTKGSEIGLKVYTPKATGWPKTELTKKALVKGITENKYKFTYLDEKLEEEDIISMINENTMDLTDCFSIIEDSTFNKIRTGRTRQSTPPPVPHKRQYQRKNSL